VNAITSGTNLSPTLADPMADPGELIASYQNSHHDAVLPVALMLACPTCPAMLG
jgi:hypothetical protein